MNFKVVLVNFIDNDGDSNTAKDYAYFTVIEDLGVGEVVVVEARHFCGLAKVVKTTGLTAKEHAAATRWVINRVDFLAIHEVKKQAELIFEIKAQLRKAREDFEERRIYELLAKDDKNIAALMAQLDELTKGEVKQLK